MKAAVFTARPALALLLAFFSLGLTGCHEDETVDRTVVMGGDQKKVCEAETRKCERNDVFRCNSAGTEWVFLKECTDGRICKEGDCIAAGGDGDGESADRDVESSGAEERKICEPEKRRCDRNDVVKCDSSGSEWLFFKECTNGRTCKDGDCIGPGPDGDDEVDGEVS